MEKYLDSCSEPTPRCCYCEVAGKHIELIEDEKCKESNKELRWLQAKGYFPMQSPQLRCPKCGIFFSKDNPWIYFSVDKFVKKISKKQRPSLLQRIFGLRR